MSEQYTITLDTNVPALDDLKGDSHFPTRHEAAMSIASVVAQLATLGFVKRDLIPFDEDSYQLKFRMELGGEFMEAHVYPRGEEVLPKKEIDGLFVKMKEHLLGDGMDEVVLGVIDDIYKGVHPRNTPALPPLTVGDLRSIKGWWRAKWIISEMVNVACGRTVNVMLRQHLGWGDERIMKEVDLIAELFGAVEDTQPKIVERLVGKTIALYGDKPVDVNASKAAKERVVSYVEEKSGHEYLDSDGYGFD